MKSSIKNPPERDICIKLAEKQLEEILLTRDDIVAAYSDGSVARDDMVPGSDIDIAIIVENINEPWYVWRIVEKEHDILIEWGFISKNRYKNINRILEDAGFTHDIAHAYVYYDSKGFFRNVKKEVLARYKEKKGILKRAENQLNQVKKGIKAIESGMEDKNKELVHYSISPVIHYSLGFPCAILNRPVTTSRGFLFCEKACQDLKVPEYKELVLEFMGSNNLYKKDVKKLLNNTGKIIKSDKLTQNEKITYLYHLHATQYLIDSGLWREATWPIFMWSSIIVKELQQRKGEDKIDVKNLWYEMLEILGWVELEGIKNKLYYGKEIVKLDSTVLKSIR